MEDINVVALLNGDASYYLSIGEEERACNLFVAAFAELLVTTKSSDLMCLEEIVNTGVCYWYTHRDSIQSSMLASPPQGSLRGPPSACVTLGNDHCSHGQQGVSTKLRKRRSELERPYMFQEAVELNPSVSLNDETQALAFAAAILFNLGLIVHKSESIAVDKCLQHATDALYDSCISILLSEKLMSLDCSKLLVMALNNKASLCFQIGDFERTQQVVNYLTYEMAKQCPTGLRLDEIECVLLNARILEKSLLCAPAA